MSVICSDCGLCLNSNNFTSGHKKCKSCRAKLEKEKRGIKAQEKFIENTKIARSVALALKDESAYFDTTEVKSLTYIKPYSSSFMKHLSLSKKLAGVKEYNEIINKFNKDLFVLLQTNYKKKVDKESIKNLVKSLRKTITSDKVDIDISNLERVIKSANKLINNFADSYKEEIKRKKKKKGSKKQSKSKTDSSSSSKSKTDSESKCQSYIYNSSSEGEDEDDVISLISNFSYEEEVEEVSPLSKLDTKINDFIDLLKLTHFSSKDKKVEENAKIKVDGILEKLRKASILIQKKTA